ncbi:hypothetical protein F5Y02DRAFT_413265 [Annulohypoxylon stygium]|nr:hypothetical protein F5Y02DRAFT_413265 [Annulohypoxylon stygium]
MKQKKNRHTLIRPLRDTPNFSLSPKAFNDFSQFVEKQAKQHIEELSENNKSFIPFPILRDYWKPRKIASILNASDPPLPFSIDTIHNGYIRVFSMLVYCNQVPNLEHFTKHNLHDNMLPLKKRPDEWKGGFYNTLFNSVSEYQWMFFPLLFAPTHLEDCRLDSHHVLPIVKLERITHERTTQGDAAIIRKMTIHDSCHDLIKAHPGQPKQSTFVLKTYHNQRYYPIYENEVAALRTLKNSKSENVITYYGSFRQSGTCNIILEYANGGDLAEFLRKTPHPKGDQVIQFWQSMSLCLKGLHCIHHLMNTGNNLNGIHEDIKPENIVLFKGSSGSPYDFIPKIADFGLFTRVKGSKTNSLDAMGRDRVGNQFYSSPESSHHALYHENTPNTLNTRADIFSFGTVLSEASAWVKGGPNEITNYYQRRKALHQSLRAFRGNDYEGCFHDGVKRLAAVDEMHAIIRKHCGSVNDLITPRVIDIIEKHMLLRNPNSRSNAWQLQDMFQQIFDAPNNEKLDPLPDISTLESPVIERQGLSLAELGNYLTRRRSIASRDGSDQQSYMRTELEKLVEDLKVNVPDRHHLFFIDDSTSMKEHTDSIDKAFVGLLHLTRRLEGRKVELSFASGPRRPYCKRRERKLRQLVQRREYQRDPDMMEDRFNRFIDGVIIPRLPNKWFGIDINICTRKPTSVYFITDGNWREDDPAACGVEKHIIRLRKELSERNLDSNYISFHFVRLGDYENGKRYLGYLDRFGRISEEDNVDVKTMASSVKSILVGPLSRTNDESGEEDDFM